MRFISGYFNSTYQCQYQQGTGEMKQFVFHNLVSLLNEGLGLIENTIKERPHRVSILDTKLGES